MTADPHLDATAGPPPSRHGVLASPVPPSGAAPDWTICEDWEAFTLGEHRVWRLLFARQQKLLSGHAVAAFGQGLARLRLSSAAIPRLDEVNQRLHACTGWRTVPVPGLIPDETFFGHLSRRRFPVGHFIRRADQLDYLEEPDIFHDMFGHVPLLAHPPLADFMQALGELGLEAMACGALHRIARLYWYVVEFGLCREAGAARISGAGILSSSGESVHALGSLRPQRVGFDLRRVMRTGYVTDRLQATYFIIDDFSDLMRLVDACDFPALYRELDPLADLDPSSVGPGHRLAA